MTTTALNLSMELKDLHHELRTPLTGILGAATLLQDKKLTQIQRNEFIDIILQSAKRLLDTSNHILNSPIEELETNSSATSKADSQPTLILKFSATQPHFFKKLGLAASK